MLTIVQTTVGIRYQIILLLKVKGSSGGTGIVYTFVMVVVGVSWAMLCTIDHYSLSGTSIWLYSDL